MLLAFAAGVATGPIVLDVPVFSPGEGGTAAFRIPGLVSMPASNSSSNSGGVGDGGVLMAFAEGRVENCADFGGIHTIVSKRSMDGGRSWSALRTLLDPAALFGNGTCPRGLRDGCEFWDPTPVYDAQGGGALHVLATLSTTSAERMSGRLTLWQLTSADRGASWGAPRNITAQVAHAELGVMTPGNGHGVQLAPVATVGGGAGVGGGGGGGGRLLVAGYVRPQGDGSEFCATIASDDGGGNWSLQTAHGAAGNGTSECEVAQLHGGGGTGGGAGTVGLLVMDERMNRDAQAARGGCGGGVATCRWRSTSADGGATWQGLAPVPELPDPSCKGGIVAWAGGGGAALVQSSCGSQAARVNLTLRVSMDGGASWPAERQVLLSAAAGYSDVQVQARAEGEQQQQQQQQQRAANEAAVLYEASACGGIRLAIVALDAI